MPDPDLKIKIEVQKEGAGAQQAKTELDQLKETAGHADSSVGGMSTRLHGLTSVFHGLSFALSSAQSGIRGLAIGIGGLFQIIFAHPIGRLVGAFLMLAGTLVTVVSRLRTTKETIEETKSKADIAAKALENIAQTNLDNLKKSISDLNNELDQTLAKSDAALESLKAMREVELASEKAKNKTAVASGQITPEEGERRNAIAAHKTKTEMIEANTQKLEQDQSDIEDTDNKNRTKLNQLRQKKQKQDAAYDAAAQSALWAGTVTQQELDAAGGPKGSAEDLAGAKKRAEAEKKSADQNLLWAQRGGPTSPKLPEALGKAITAASNLKNVEDLQTIIPLKKTATEQYDASAPELENKITRDSALYTKNRLQLELAPRELETADEELKSTLLEQNTKEEQRKKTEELKLKRESLEREYQKAEEAKNKVKAEQLSKALAATKVQEYETSIMGTKVEPAMKAAEIKNINEQQAAVFEKFTAEQDKKAIEERADLALQKESAEEKMAELRLQAAGKAVGAKHLSPREKALREAALESAKSQFGKESADVSKAKDYVSKIRETSDAATLRELIQALERMIAADSEKQNLLNQGTNMINQHTVQLRQQASQLQNGGLRTR